MSEVEEQYDEYLRRIYKWNVFGLILSWTVWGPFQSMADPYFQLYAYELGATPVILGAISFVSTITLGFSRILGGYVADKYGRKKIVVCMTGLFSFSFLIYAYAPDWTWLVIAAFLSNVALLYQPALWSIEADSTPKELRGKLFSLYHFLPDIISSFSPLLAIYFISRYTFVPAIRLIYFLCFVSGVTAATIRGVFLKETLLKHETLDDKILKFGEAYRVALRFVKEKLLYVVLVDVTANIALSMTFLTSIYSVVFLGVSEIGWGYISSFSHFLALLFLVPFGFLIDKIGRKPILVISTLFSLFSCFLLFAAPYMVFKPFILALIAVSLMSIGNFVYFTAITTIITDLVPLELRGRVNSIEGLIINVVSSVVTLATGLIYSLIGPNAPYLIATITLLLAISIILLKIRETK